MRLRAEDYIDDIAEGHYATYPMDQIISKPHTHDFYEIFLITDGQVIHHINNEEIVLKHDSLVFIRPDDSHAFSKYAEDTCRLANLAFLVRTFESLSDYLGLASHVDILLHPTIPPTIQLTSVASTRLQSQLAQWGHTLYRDRDHARIELRSILANIMTDCFISSTTDPVHHIPQWLAELCQLMQQHDHLVEGRTALLRLANRTPEYVGRAFREYLDTTPSEFINDLRLDYASELLLYTDDPVIEICYAVGFGNLSHFHHRFKERYDVSPLAFRKSNRRSLIP